MLQREMRGIENSREHGIAAGTTKRLERNRERHREIAYSKCGIMGSRYKRSAPIGAAGRVGLSIDTASTGSTRFADLIE